MYKLHYITASHCCSSIYWTLLLFAVHCKITLHCTPSHGNTLFHCTMHFYCTAKLQNNAQYCTAPYHCSHCTAVFCCNAMQLNSLCRQTAIIYSSDFKRTLPLSPEPRGEGGGWMQIAGIASSGTLVASQVWPKVSVLTKITLLTKSHIHDQILSKAANSRHRLIRDTCFLLLLLSSHRCLLPFPTSL